MALPGLRRPAPSERPTSQPREESSVAEAVAELYRACHLAPPAVLVAEDAVRFGRTAALLFRGRHPGAVLLATVLVMLLACLVLAARGSVVAAAYAALLPVLIVPMLRGLHRLEGGGSPTHLWAVLQSGLLALSGAAAWGLARQGGLDARPAAFAAGAVVGAIASAQLVSDLVGPVLARWRLLRGSPATGLAARLVTSLRGTASAAPVVLSRLASALDEQGGEGRARLHLVGASGSHRGSAQWAVQRVIDLEMLRLGVTGLDRGLVLGQSIGHSFDPAARVGALAEVDPARLPRILRAAVAIDRRAEAVCALQGVAVVLPAGAPTTLTAASAPPGRSWRRSRRAPWHAALQWLDDAPGLALALDLAPSARLADWLLARRIRRVREAARRTPAIQALGPARTVAALRLCPVQEDAAGQLYQIGPAEDPSVFVAVQDRVLDVQGRPLEHWIGVPPHVATAREGVAWSFGLGEAAYQPAQET